MGKLLLRFCFGARKDRSLSARECKHDIFEAKALGASRKIAGLVGANGSHGIFDIAAGHDVGL